jgi:hypothetical protein
MRECGVDLIIFDDTNWVWVDDRKIDQIIQAWFSFMDALPLEQRIPLTMGIGGGLNQHNSRESWLNEVAYIWEAYAARPSTARVGPRPLLVWYIEKNVMPEWDDPRFAVLRAYHAYRTADQAAGNGWGWGSTPGPPENHYCMSFFPGWSLKGTDQIPRERGEYYKQCWIKALQVRPGWVCIADWNNFDEETAIEDAWEWVDYRDESCPSWYRWLTRCYAGLRTGQLLEGSYYRDKAHPEVYLWQNKQLIHQGQYPAGAPIIDTPPEWLLPLAAKQ